MKKDRNAFFQNQSASSYFYPSAPNMGGMMPNAGGYPMATESSSNFYQGPIVGAPMPAASEYSSELESRLAKIERQISRLDTRVTKLESEFPNPSNAGTDYTTNNMYML
ncbi:MAG TPA: hypothetical protein DCY94_01820 [Firmicutes bacterium]|nr:hypothetical protein [Bacillota bacterium]